MPLFFAMPIEIGGLGFDPRRIGYVLGIHKAVVAIFMATYFPKIVRYIGERWTYVLAMSTFLLLWVLFPVMNLCARQYGISTGVWTGISLWIVLTTSTDMAYSSFRLFFSPRSSETDDVISTSRLHLCVRHRSGAQQAFSGSNSRPRTDNCCNSEHYSPLVVDVSLFLFRGTQSSWRLCGVRRLLVLVVFFGVGCNEIAS